MRRFIWESSDLTAYESTWSLISKFASGNYIASHDELNDFITKETFKNTPCKAIKLSNESNHYIRSLPKLIINNPNRILSYLTSFCFTSSNTKNKLEELIYKELRFCPICIESGFHSPIFQMKWLDKCPTHDVYLSICCPSCNKKIKHDISSDVFFNPYGCGCGYKLWTKNNISKLSKTHIRLMKSKIDSFIHWKSNLSNTPLLFIGDLWAKWENNPMIVSSKRICSAIGYTAYIKNINNWNQLSFTKIPGERHYHTKFSINLNNSNTLGFDGNLQDKKMLITLTDNAFLINESCGKLYTSVYYDVYNWLKSQVVKEHSVCAKDYSCINNQTIINDRRQKPQCLTGMSFNYWKKKYAPPDRPLNYYAKSASSPWIDIIECYHLIYKWTGCEKYKTGKRHEFLLKASTTIFREALISSFVDGLEYHKKYFSRDSIKQTPNKYIESNVPYFILYYDSNKKAIIMHWWQKWDVTSLKNKVKTLNCTNKI